MIGERLRVARARAKVTMRDLGKAISVSAQSIKKYEDNICMPNSKALVKMCAALDVSAEWLLCGEPLDFRSTEQAPQGRHAKYWVRECLAEMKEEGLL